MKHSRDTMIAAAYLRHRLPFMKAWDVAATRRWVGWFMAHGRAIMTWNGRRIVGVALVRLLDNASRALDPWADTDGRIAYIEVAACEKGTLPHLFYLFRHTFPHASHMSWVRSKYNNRPITITMAKATQRFAA